MCVCAGVNYYSERQVLVLDSSVVLSFMDSLHTCSTSLLRYTAIPVFTNHNMTACQSTRGHQEWTQNPCQQSLYNTRTNIFLLNQSCDPDTKSRVFGTHIYLLFRQIPAFCHFFHWIKLILSVCLYVWSLWTPKWPNIENSNLVWKTTFYPVIVWELHVIWLCQWICIRILRVLLSILFPPQIQHKTLQSRKRNGIGHNEH